MNIGVDLPMYRRPVCVAKDCDGQLVVGFDDYTDPEVIYILCGKCGHVVAVLGNRGGITEPPHPLHCFQTAIPAAS